MAKNRYTVPRIRANDTVVLDANGNIQTKDTWTFTHNVNNRLVAANDNGTPVASYNYNALGQRISKTVGGSTTQFIYGLNGELLAELDGSGTVLREYVYLNGTPLAVIDGTTIHYIHTDHLGTPRAVSDATGTLVWYWNSDPFGQVAANDDPDGDGTAFVFNLRFPGQYYDAETGLHYNYFRDYDPSTGRYVQSDPIGLAGGLNTYGYVGGNPIYWIDPYGLCVQLPGWVKEILNTVRDKGFLQYQFGAGRIWGLNGRIKLSRNGLSGYGGLGLGFGTSHAVVAGASTGSTSGFTIRSAVSVGVRKPFGINTSMSWSTGGNDISVGAGATVGDSATITAGFSGDIWKFDAGKLFDNVVGWVESIDCEDSECK